ncbi:MAG TPA: hypothetical protein DEP47_14860, partial [Chloroflexi bacterium]|nr:hypothetical protein [Chloroflexota bacterium]
LFSRSNYLIRLFSKFLPSGAKNLPVDTDALLDRQQQSNSASLWIRNSFPQVSVSTQLRHKLITGSQFMCQYGFLSGS